jgi:hypothetical protein
VHRSAGFVAAMGSNSGVISRVVLDSKEMMEESEDEKAIAKERRAYWCSC